MDTLNSMIIARDTIKALREALVAGNEVINHMGDRLNDMDCADPESVEFCEPRMEMVSKALASTQEDAP